MRESFHGAVAACAKLGWISVELKSDLMLSMTGTAYDNPEMGVGGYIETVNMHFPHAFTAVSSTTTTSHKRERGRPAFPQLPNSS